MWLWAGLAGAAIMPEHMIAHGQVGATPLAGMVSLAPGLGLTVASLSTSTFVSATDSDAFCALSYNPFVVGLGLDEDTAAFISPDNEIRVVGSGVVTVVDVGGLSHSSPLTRGVSRSA